MAAPGSFSCSLSSTRVVVAWSWILLLIYVNCLVSAQLEDATVAIPCASKRSSDLLFDDNGCNCLEIRAAETLPVRDPGFGGVDGVFEPLMNVLTWGNHDDYETPILIRQFQWTMVANWNIVAAHHPTALNAFGRNPTYRRCISLDSDSAELLQLHQTIAIAYSILYASKLFFPNAYDYVAQKFQLDYGLNPTICHDGNEDSTAASNNGNNCENDLSTPWGLAYHVVFNEIESLAQADGWNADGSYSRKYNRIPFEDWRGRTTKTKYQPNYNDADSWKPLLEHNNIGYITRQEHVTPHIGQVAKSFYLSNDDICGLQAPDPNYDYGLEIPLVLERTTNLDDVQKIQVEIFDNKVTLFAPLVSQYFRRIADKAGTASSRPGTAAATANDTTAVEVDGQSSVSILDQFEHIQALYMVVSALYEATIIVWKEKVRHDKIRPTTKVHDMLGETIVTGYADGTTQQDLPADNWEPFVRTMPHSEYPSGSSCLCEAAASVLKKLLGDRRFVDDDVLGTLLTMPKIENSKVVGVDTPSEMAYESWDEIATICGQSRLWGGMHFTASVPAGHELCHPIGNQIYESINNLALGRVPAFVMDVASNGGSGNEEQGENQHLCLHSPPVVEIRCPDDFIATNTTGESFDSVNDDDNASGTVMKGATAPALLVWFLLSVLCF